MLAKLLDCEYRVHIVGFSNGEIWEPLRNDTSIEYRPIRFRHRLGYAFGAAHAVRTHVEGKLILAVKPIQASFGLGLTAKRILGRPLLLDIDDWEMGFLSKSVCREAQLLKQRWFSDVNSPLYTRWLNGKTGCADAVTVSSSFLQKRFGGFWIGQARDETIFDAARFGHRKIATKTVLFLGTAREHKGLDDLVAGWSLVKSPNARLRIVGTPLEDPIIKRMAERADDRVSFDGLIPFEQVPETIAAADVFVLPQRNCRASVGQMPMKLIDAMALGCAIIGTSVGDIPFWLHDGAGLIVQPSNPASLAHEIDRLIMANSEERKTLGQLARQRFLEFGSFKSVRHRLMPLVADLIGGRRPARPQPAFSEHYRSRLD